MNDWILTLLAQQDGGIDPFDDGLLSQISDACRKQNLDFRVLDPIAQGSSYLDARQKPTWDLETEFRTEAGVLPPVLLRPGIELDGTVLIKPRVKIVLPEAEPWGHHPDQPQSVAEAFDSIREAYALHRAERMLAKRSRIESVLSQIRFAWSALARAIQAQPDSDWMPWMRFVNGVFTDWMVAPDTDFAATILGPDALRQHPDGTALLIKLPTPHFFHGFGFSQDAPPVPCMGRLKPSPKLEHVVRAFFDTGMDAKCLEGVQALIDSGDAWHDPELIRALVRAYRQAEEASFVEGDEQRELLSHLEQCGVAWLGKGRRYVPGEESLHGPIDFVWDPAPPGSVIQATHTGFTFENQVIGAFRGVVSLGPKPALYTFLEKCSLALTLPEPDGLTYLRGTDDYCRTLLRVFFQHQSDLRDGERIDFVRSLLSGSFGAAGDLVALYPDAELSSWLDAPTSHGLDRLKAHETDFELAATTSSVLATPSIDIFPGMRFERYHTFPIISVCLPLSRDLAQRYGHPNAIAPDHTGSRFCNAVLEVAARNVLSAKDPFFEDINQRSQHILSARIREAYLDFRNRVAHLETAEKSRQSKHVDTFLDQVAVHLEGGDPPLAPIRFPSTYGEMARRADPTRHQIDFAFDGRVPANQAIIQISGLAVQDEVLAPAQSTYSLGACPDWVEENPGLFNWIEQLAVSLIQDPDRPPVALETATQVLNPLRSDGPENRHRFMQMARFLTDLSPRFEIVGTTWASYAAHADMSLAEIIVADSDVARANLMDHEDYWPGLVFDDTPLLPIQGTVERPRRAVERQIHEALDGHKEAQKRVRRCFDHALGDVDLLTNEDRLIVFRQVMDHADQVDASLIDAVLQGSNLKRLEPGDELPRSVHQADTVHWVFDNRADFGRVLTTVPFSVVAVNAEGEPDQVMALAPLSVSCGPKWEELNTLIDLFQTCAVQTHDRDQLQDRGRRAAALKPGPTYRDEAEALFIDVLHLGYAPSLDWQSSNDAILSCLAQSLERGFAKLTEGHEFQHMYLVMEPGAPDIFDDETPAKPSLVVNTASERHIFKGLIHKHIAIPDGLSDLFCLMRHRLPMHHENRQTLQEMVARALVDALRQADPTQLLELGQKLCATDLDDLESLFGLSLALHPDHATDPTLMRRRPWSTYSANVPKGDKTVHQFGYRFGDEFQPLIWSESLGSLDEGIKAEREIDVVIPFLYEFFESFEHTMVEALGSDDETTEKIHGLISEWHHKLLLEFPQLPPTTLVSRIHKNIYQTLERWNMVPEDFGQTYLRKLQDVYAAIESAHQEGGKRARVSLVTCEPGHVIQPGERDQFETTTRKTPPAGAQADLVASGLVILLDGRGDTIKAVIRMRAKNRS